MRVPIRFVTEHGGRVARRREPVTMGVPLPRGLVADPHRLAVEDAAGRRIPLQVRPLDRWSDGSVRWALLDFQAHADFSRAQIADAFELVINAAPTEAAFRPSIQTRDATDTITVDTGATVFTVQVGRTLFAEISVNGRPVIDPATTGFTLESTSGEQWPVIVEQVTLEEIGPIRSVVSATGYVQAADQSRVVEVTVRIHFFAGSAIARIDATLRNPRAAQHPEGFWELGDPASVYWRDMSFAVGRLPDSGEASTWCSEEIGTPARPLLLPFELYQASSGGDHWNHTNHVNRSGDVPVRSRGYRLQSGQVDRHGDRATPIVGMRSNQQSLAIACPLFWQNFPKAIELTNSGLLLRLFPKQFADDYELQGGEQKTHSFYVAFDVDVVSDLPLDWCRNPLRGSLPPSWYCHSSAVPYMTPRGAPAEADYEAMIDAALDPLTGFVAKREVIDEYGWRHFGDLYADHEAVFERRHALASHYNNQYDAICGFATQFMRSGDHQWWTLMDDLARHVIDIDIYRTDGDKAAYNNGLFWHTYHYVDAGLSTHRTYPRSPKVPGGGLSNEHNYATGLMLYYFLTGNPAARDTAIGLARWVVDMDDGCKTKFRWLARTPTGLASQTVSTDYHGPGRGAAYSVRALLDGHRLAHDQTLLNKADELICRVVHPDDELPARNLLDAERRWSYTVFLQVVASYLDYKAECGQLDRMYAYARASLLHYVRWMAEYEYPYLGKPEVLEYPTETWAAQDLRKSDVFYHAAHHTSGAERERFQERGQHFYEISIATLRQMKTHTLTRPVVLLLTNGVMHGYSEARKDANPAPLVVGDADFGRPQHFIPQKRRAQRRVVALTGMGVGLLALASILSACTS